MTLIENSSQQKAVAAVYIAAMFLSVLDTTIVTVALPAIGREFGVPQSSVGAVPIAYLVALTVFIPMAGWLGDRFGGTRILLGSIGLFTLGSALCGVAGSLLTLVVFSVLQGVGGAIMLPVGLSMLFRVYPPGERVRVSSVVALFTAVGPALGPILGGVFTSFLSWRLVFFVNVPVGLAVIVWGAIRLQPHRQPDPGRLDVPGLLLSALGFGSVMLGISEGPRAGWASPVVLATIAAGVLLLGALVVTELRTERPLIAFRLFRHHPLFTAATCLYGLGSVAYIGALYLVALFLQDGLGLSAVQSGLISFFSALGVMAGGQLVTRVLYHRLGPRRLISAGLLLMALALGLMALVATDTSPWLIRLDMLLLGLGVSGVFIPSQAISMATITKADTGAASPLFSAGKQLGSAVGVSLLSTVVALASTRAGVHGAAAAANVATDAYRAGFLVAAVVAAAALGVSMRIRDRDAAATMVPRAAHPGRPPRH